MNEEEKSRIKAEAFKEANIDQRIKALEDGFNEFRGALKWFFRALWGGIAYLVTQIVSFLFSNGWPK